LADAPNNPASSYHPVAISRVKSKGNTDINHLLVVGNTDQKHTFSYEDGVFTIGNAENTYQVFLNKYLSSVTGMVLKRTEIKSSLTHYVGYTVNQFLDDKISILSGL
jgi:hypothetical protein